MNMKMVHDMYTAICEDAHFAEQFIAPMVDYISTLTLGKPVLLNPMLGGKYEHAIPADCDMVVDKVLIDFKCTTTGKEFEVLQLLGYAALLQQNPTYRLHVNQLCIMNFLDGTVHFYQCDLPSEAYTAYLKLLHP